MILPYIIKSAMALALLYACIVQLLEKETFHRLNRILILGCLIMSFAIPLVHFAGRERAPLNTGEFCRFAEDDALDGETHAHTDGVCRHHNARLVRREFPNLFAAGRRRQRTLDDACFDMVLLL